MRRFKIIRIADGAEVGEGVEFSDKSVSYRTASRPDRLGAGDAPGVDFFPPLGLSVAWLDPPR